MLIRTTVGISPIQKKTYAVIIARHYFYSEIEGKMFFLGAYMRQAIPIAAALARVASSGFHANPWERR